MIVACQWKRSSPTGPALQFAGGSRPRSCVDNGARYDGARASGGLGAEALSRPRAGSGACVGGRPGPRRWRAGAPRAFHKSGGGNGLSGVCANEGKRPREQHANFLYRWRQAGGSGCWRAAAPHASPPAREASFALLLFCPSTRAVLQFFYAGLSTCSSLLIRLSAML